MTDLETIKSMLEKAQVPYSLLPNDPDDPKDLETHIHVECFNGKVRGYIGFISVFYFDLEGNLITMGCWE